LSACYFEDLTMQLFCFLIYTFRAQKMRFLCAGRASLRESYAAMTPLFTALGGRNRELTAFGKAHVAAWRELLPQQREEAEKSE
jgi:hypothetical protein